MSQAQAIHQDFTDREKIAIIKEALGAKYEVAENNLPLLKEIMDRVDKIDNGFSIVELIPYFNRILDLKIFSIMAEGASVLSIFFFPVSALIDVINAYQTGARMYSYRAIAYDLTSWAFNDAPAHSSQKILSNLVSGFPVPPNKSRALKEYKEAWKKSETDVVLKMKSITIQYSIPEEVMKLFVRALASNNRQILCQSILKGFEKQFNFVQDLWAWKSGYSIKYPM